MYGSMGCHLGACLQTVCHQLQRCTAVVVLRSHAACAALTCSLCCCHVAQVALTLAVAEEACAFEHRDLHWGNVLLKPADSTTMRCTYRGMQVRQGAAVISRQCAG